MREEYPATFDFTGPALHSCTTRRKGKKMPMPLYGAGFLMNPVWFNTVYLPRMSAFSHRHIIPKSLSKHGIELKRHLHRSATIMYHYDQNGHLFFNLCHNGPTHKRLEWLEKRDVHLQAICEALDFTPEEIEQAQKNFKWYMITPTGVMRVPLDITVHGSVTEGSYCEDAWDAESTPSPLVED